MKKGTLFAGIASAFVASALTLGLTATPAVAATATVDENAKAEIQKTVYANKDIDISSDSFDFTATPLGIVDTTTGRITDVTTNMPSIDGITINGFTNITGTGVSSVKTGDFTISGLNFPSAGVYAYTVKETAGSDTTITYAKEEYVMYLYVNNTEDTDNPDANLKITQVGFVKTKDASGNTVSYDKATEKVTANFTNVHTPTSNLLVSKQVTGNYGDKTKDFSIAIEVTLPANYTTDSSDDFYTAPESFTATYKVVREGDNPAHTTHSNITLTKGDNGKYTGTLLLADGEQVEIDGLPVGSTYTLNETAVTGYDPSYAYASSATNNQTIGATKDAQTAVVTNKYTPTTPTGILMNALPYMVLIGIPVAALIGYVMIRSKRYAQGA